MIAAAGMIPAVKLTVWNRSSEAPCRRDGIDYCGVLISLVARTSVGIGAEIRTGMLAEASTTNNIKPLLQLNYFVSSRSLSTSHSVSRCGHNPAAVVESGRNPKP